MEMPDITRLQVVAIVQAILAVLVSFGIDLTDRQETALLGLAGALAVVLPLSDAIIRNGRSRIYAASVTRSNDE